MRVRILALSLLTCASLAQTAEAQAYFGSVQVAGRTSEITWDPAHAAQLSRDSLLIVEPGALVRSAALPLRALQLYDITATMRRGPGSQLEFAVVYVDQHGKEQRWLPSWQAPTAVRPAGTPLAPRSATYLQSLVLPLGARRVHLELKLERSQERQLARYASWELTQLEFVERRAVACCEHTGPNLLVGGDLETPVQAGLPIGWSAWNPGPKNRIELVTSAREPEAKHMLRFHAGVGTLLASTPELDVTRGTAYRISLRARGEGDVQVVVQALVRNEPLPIRIGNLTTVVHTIASRTWVRVESVWFAEPPGIEAAQLVLAVTTRSQLEIDAIDFRPYVR